MIINQLMPNKNLFYAHVKENVLKKNNHENYSFNIRGKLFKESKSANQKEL